MYEKVFHFSSRPFTSTPFVKHYFSGDSIHQALEQARICVDRASGPVMAVGGAGTGKSLLLAMLEHHYQTQFNVVNLACAKLEKRQDLLQSILFELNQPYQGMSDAELRFALIDYLSPNEQCPHGILLLIDEAHLLSHEMLDEVRLITNFVRDGLPRVRLVMAGNQRLEENLAEPKLESFNQRIAARCYLSNMSREETARYVVEHIDRAGGDGGQLFDESSLKAVYEVSDGCPRLVNQVCDHALILASTRGESVITDQCVLEAWSDVQSIPGDWAAPATQPDSVSELQNDESWTVIEFGKLEDAEQSTDSTIYDFENSQPPTESTDIEEADEQDSWESSDQPEPTENELTSTESEAEWDQPESFAVESNQTEWESPESDETVQDQADTFAEDTADAQMESPNAEESWNDGFSDFNADSESTESISESVEVTENAGGDTSEPANDDDSNDADEMETQLNAVFGEGLAATEISQEKEIAELEAEQEALLDQVESVPTAADQSPPEFASDSNCKIASESQSHEHSDPQTPVDEHHEMPLENQFMAPDPNLDDADPVADSFQDPQEALEPHEPEPVGETVDPFAEEFAEEEHLIDRFAPFVAHQNQSSLTVTSSDLEMIRPLESEQETEGSGDFHATGEDETDNVDAFASSVTEESTAELETGESFEVPVSVDPIAEVESSENDPVYAATDDIGCDVTPNAPGVFVIEAETAGEVESFSGELDHAAEIEQVAEKDSRAETELSAADYESALIAASEVSEAATAEPEIEPVENEPTFHTHLTESTSVDIERQAEEILKRLGVSQNVSCETGHSEPVNIDSAESPEDPVPPQEHDLTPRAAVPTVPLVAMTRPGVPTQLFEIPEEPSDFDKQSAALDETQQILNEILAQKNLLASQTPQSVVDQPSTSQIETAGLPGSHQENPASDDTAAQQDETHVDDREMIIVNKMEQQSDSTETEPEQPISFPSTPISKGRAERMDYQKLFDQLRDISDTKQ